MKRATLYKYLRIVLAVVLIAVACILLARRYATVNLAIRSVPLISPVLDGAGVETGCVRQTEIFFYGRKKVKVTDCFTLRNDGSEAQTYTVVVPVLPAAEWEAFQVKITVNEMPCSVFYTDSGASWDSGEPLTPLADGTWTRAVFPNGIANRGRPAGEVQGGSFADSSNSHRLVRFFAADYAVPVGSELRIQLTYRFTPSAELTFFSNDGAVSCASHTVTLSGLDSVKITGQNLTDDSLPEGTPIALDPAKTDYHLQFVMWKYR